MEVLRRHLLFSSLDDMQLSRVLETATTMQLAEGEHLFMQQQPARFFYLLKSGQIKLYRLSQGGEEKVIELINPGQTFAEAVMFMHGCAYPVNAQAVIASDLIGVDMAVFRSLLEQSASTCLKILGHMSMRLHGAIQEIDQLTLQNARMRVIQFLLRELPEGQGEALSICLETPKSVLASRLSVRPETFSRILQQLSQEGLLRVSGKQIEILDKVQLQRASL